MMKSIFCAFLSLLFISCNNNQSLRLNPGNTCKVETDSAQFELFDFEESLLLNVSALPSDKNFILVKEVSTIETPQNLTFSFSTTLSSSPTESLGKVSFFTSLSCLSGFAPDNTPQGSISLTPPVTDQFGSIETASIQLQYGAEEGKFAEFNLGENLQSSGSADFISYYTALGYNTKIYTPLKDDEKNIVFIIHAQSSDGKTRSRLTIKTL